MLDNKISKYFLIISLSSSISSGVKIDGFKDRILNTGNLLNPVLVKDTELKGTLERSNLNKKTHVFQNVDNDPDQTLLHYSGNITSRISYKVVNFFDLNTNPVFQFNFSDVNKDFDIQVILTDSGNTKRTSNNIAVALNNLNPSIDLNQSSNYTEKTGGSFNLHQVKNFQFYMNTGAVKDVEFDLNSIEAVPEPLSIISLGIGITGLVKKRQKNIFKNTI